MTGKWIRDREGGGAGEKGTMTGRWGSCLPIMSSLAQGPALAKAWSASVCNAVPIVWRSAQGRCRG